MPHKKRLISVRDGIFNEDEVLDEVTLQRTADKIKELDEAIQVIELPQSDKLEDIQLGEDMEVASEITRQTDHEPEDRYADNIAAKTNTDKLAEDEDQKWAQNQYPTPKPSVLEAFLANSVSMPADNLRSQHPYDTIANRNKANPCESEWWSRQDWTSWINSKNKGFTTLRSTESQLIFKMPLLQAPEWFTDESHLQNQSTIGSSRAIHLRSGSAWI